MKNKKMSLTLLGFFAVLPICLWSCDSMMYPTVSDMKTVADEEIEHRSGLQEATVQTMTDQHTALAPELEAVFAVILAQNKDMSASLKALAAEKVAAVEGPSVGSLDSLGGGMIPSLLSMFGLGSLIPIYNMFFGKSRAQKELDEMKLKMATRAGENDTGL